jgi:hypothetical protein
MPPRHSILCGIFLVTGFLGSALGQPLPARLPIVSSFSGQFVLQAAAASQPSKSTERLETNQTYIRLEPAVLAVSCERIKQLLWRQLGVSGAWQGKIYLALFPTEGPDDLVTLTSEHFMDGWQYRLDLPDVLERDRYVRALVQALLIEFANRHGGDHSAEIPLWLTEGLTRQLLSTSEIQIILPPPKHMNNGLAIVRTNLSARLDNPLRQAHQELAQSPPLTFQQLSWPAPDELSGDQCEAYKGSAQLFVRELLQFRDGPACFRKMLAELPSHYNWQFAFLHAFQGHFARPIDVEKWWAVQSLQFASRDLTRVWPLPQSWQKLDETLLTPVEVRTGPAELPMHADVSLQTILKEWEGQRREQALQIKLRELELLRHNVARELSGLVQDYCLALETYLGKRAPTWPLRAFDSKRAFEQRTVQQTAQQLNTLDARRKSLRPAAASDSALPVQASLKP